MRISDWSSDMCSSDLRTSPLSTSPAFRSDRLKSKGYEFRPNFEPPRQEHPAASVAHFLTAAYTLPSKSPQGLLSAAIDGLSPAWSAPLGVDRSGLRI